MSHRQYLMILLNIKRFTLLIFIFISVISCTKMSMMCNSDQINVNNISYDEKEINEFVNMIIEAVRNEDISYIINVLYDGEVEYDYYKFKNKKDVASHLVNKKRIYAYLFNVKEKSLHVGIEPGLMPEEMSVKDLININKNIRIDKIEVLNSKRRILRCHLTNDLEINCRKNDPNCVILGLDKIDVIIKDGRYYLYSLIFDYMPVAY